MPSDAIQEHQRAILAAHGCITRHLKAVGVRTVSKGLVTWDGVVDVYEIEGHQEAQRCYAWSYVEDRQIKTVTVLEIPPMDSPETAV